MYTSELDLGMKSMLSHYFDDEPVSHAALYRNGVSASRATQASEER